MTQWVISVGKMFYAEGTQLVTELEYAFHFNIKSEALEIVDWLEYREVENTNLVEITTMQEENTYKEISDLFDAQRQKGEMKYGGTVDEQDNDDPVYWVNHAREEVADLLVYLTKLKQKLEKLDK
ncbi:hypothetical protein H3019_gp01 [Bacillus phage Karezi]|uniref:Uncharacterized protein n=1 Tax=Bacillus phage Karezi TaxID=2591398 RepID=A0A514AAP5_9CAUD|nr:hypothetical protein H3019_gp01 [Bacillus phage Karezi]QDH50329.1 hypothetical protein KAREZI_1 [Bacillus phage Karezi]